MMRLGAGKIFLGVAGIASVFTAIGFIGLAIFVLLQPSLDVASAAAVTALILIALPMSWAVWKLFSPPPPPPPVASPQAAALGVLAGLAQKNPLLAVVGAVVLGFGQYLLRRR